MGMDTDMGFGCNKAWVIDRGIFQDEVGSRRMGVGHRRPTGDNLKNGYFPLLKPIASPTEFDIDPVQIKVFLREQAEIFEQQKNEIKQKIRELGKVIRQL